MRPGKGGRLLAVFVSAALLPWPPPARAADPNNGQQTGQNRLSPLLSDNRSEARAFLPQLRRQDIPQLSAILPDIPRENLVLLISHLRSNPELLRALDQYFQTARSGMSQPQINAMIRLKASLRGNAGPRQNPAGQAALQTAPRPARLATLERLERLMSDKVKSTAAAMTHLSRLFDKASRRGAAAPDNAVAAAVWAPAAARREPGRGSEYNKALLRTLPQGFKRSASAPPAPARLSGPDQPPFEAARWIREYLRGGPKEADALLRRDIFPEGRIETKRLDEIHERLWTMLQNKDFGEFNSHSERQADRLRQRVLRMRKAAERVPAPPPPGLSKERADYLFHVAGALEKISQLQHYQRRGDQSWFLQFDTSAKDAKREWARAAYALAERGVTGIAGSPFEELAQARSQILALDPKAFQDPELDLRRLGLLAQSYRNLSRSSQLESDPHLYGEISKIIKGDYDRQRDEYEKAYHARYGPQAVSPFQRADDIERNMRDRLAMFQAEVREFPELVNKEAPGLALGSGGALNREESGMYAQSVRLSFERMRQHRQALKELGAPAELLGTMDQAIHAALLYEHTRLEGQYKELTKAQWTIPITALAIPVALFAAAPMAAGSAFTLAGGLKAAGVGAALTAGLDANRQLLEMRVDGTRERFDPAQTLINGGMGAVLGPLLGRFKPLAQLFVTKAVYDSSESMVSEFQQGHYGGGSAGVLDMALFTLFPALARRAERPGATLPVPAPQAKMLKAYGLAPNHAIAIGETRYTVGRLMDMGDGRVGAFVLVRTEAGAENLRFFYRSNSQGTFRLLPSLTENDAGLPSYDKGPGENSLSAPPELEEYLASQSNKGRVRQDVPEALIKVAVKVNPSRDYVKGPDYILSQVKKTPLLSDTPELELRTGKGPMRGPSQIRIADPRKEPDFSAVVRRYATANDTTGKLEALVYRSRDGSLEYTVMKDAEGKIFLGNIAPLSSPINSFGVRSEWVDAGELLTPRWEYHSQLPREYLGEANLNNPSYSDAWAYLREITTIQEWYRANKLPIPDSHP